MNLSANVDASFVNNKVEQLQLDSMIMAEDGNKERYSRKNVPALMTDMDSTEKVNQEKLDLSVTSSLKKMLDGQFHAEQEEEEEEEEENYTETGIHDFILPL
ncbi:snRNA-activating protein complex subunit 5-like isoform X2 [Zootermopsis nevadensis]|uniref:snRNA-activating protein complex subunit 5-like isoform X2 n=1 Tax=Zootermopsis nevadensis TaxID=136037 RepID=UPI000B8E3A4B|nr:snRNA-activating protein complex subunit 5-like isoform X2 [Zootermopsis nevadensis]